MNLNLNQGGFPLTDSYKLLEVAWKNYVLFCFTTQLPVAKFLSNNTQMYSKNYLSRNYICSSQQKDCCRVISFTWVSFDTFSFLGLQTSFDNNLKELCLFFTLSLSVLLTVSSVINFYYSGSDFFFSKNHFPFFIPVDIFLLPLLLSSYNEVVSYFIWSQ